MYYLNIVRIMYVIYIDIYYKHVVGASRLGDGRPLVQQPHPIYIHNIIYINIICIILILYVLCM